MFKKVLLSLIVICFLFVVSFSSMCYASSDITFAWDMDPCEDLAGFRLYESSASGVYDMNVPITEIEDPNQRQYTLTGVEDGTYYFVLVAYDLTNNVSDPSNEVCASLDTKSPGNPKNFKIISIFKVIIETSQ